MWAWWVDCYWIAISNLKFCKKKKNQIERWNWKEREEKKSENKNIMTSGVVRMKRHYFPTETHTFKDLFYSFFSGVPFPRLLLLLLSLLLFVLLLEMYFKITNIPFGFVRKMRVIRNHRKIPESEVKGLNF